MRALHRSSHCISMKRRTFAETPRKAAPAGETGAATFRGRMILAGIYSFLHGRSTSQVHPLHPEGRDGAGMFSTMRCAASSASRGILTVRWRSAAKRQPKR